MDLPLIGNVMELSWIPFLLLLLLIYKICGRLIRLPTIGRFGKHVFITGCDSGFGNLLAKRLDGKGVNVFAGCFTEKGETELRKACSSRLVTVPLDVSKHESVVKAYELVKQKLPADQGLWGIVNNAGVGGLVAPLEMATLKDYQSVFDINTFGMVDVATTFLPLVKKERGRVVNMISAAGRITVVGLTIYCMSKFAMEAFTDILRRQMRVFGVRVLTIEPGFYRTGINDAKHHEVMLKKAYSESSQAVQKEYGQDYIKLFQKLLFDDMMATALSDKLYHVIDAYEHALFGMFPRGRYVVGWDAVALIAFEYLPEWMSDWISETIGNVRQLVPASIKNA